MGILAGLAVGTEAREVEFADGFTDVFLSAGRSEGTEAFVVVGARGEFGGGVDVEV